jgi:hypothetical protein
MQSRRRDLVEKRLKQVMVVLVDQDDVGFGTAKRARSGHTGKTAPDNHDPWLSQIHAGSSAYL